MLRPLLLLCLAVGIAGSARSQDPDAATEKAKKAYSDASDKARNTLLEAFTTATKMATASGNLDVVKALQTEKEAFEATGKLPMSARMKTAVVNYQLSMKQVTTTLEKAYEQSIKDLTKAGKLAQAEAVQAELKEFRNKAPTASLRPADVANKEDLQKYLADSVWVWDDGLKLKADGTTEQRAWLMAGLVTKWEAVDRRTVVLWIEKGRNTDRVATLVFNEDVTEAKGFNFDGVRITSLKRKP